MYTQANKCAGAQHGTLFWSASSILSPMRLFSAPLPLILPSGIQAERASLFYHHLGPVKSPLRDPATSHGIAPSPPVSHDVRLPSTLTGARGPFRFSKWFVRVKFQVLGTKNKQATHDFTAQMVTNQVIMCTVSVNLRMRQPAWGHIII